MSYTIEELNAAIQDEETSWEGSWFEFQYELESNHEWREEGGARGYYPKVIPGLDIPGIGRAVQLDQYGGEDQGTQLWLVFQVIAAGETRIFKRHGWYQSYSGGGYDGPTVEVKAVEKLVTVYEEIE